MVIEKTSSRKSCTIPHGPWTKQSITFAEHAHVVEVLTALVARNCSACKEPMGFRLLEENHIVSYTEPQPHLLAPYGIKRRLLFCTRRGRLHIT
jgi:hypothetical protein